MESQFCVHVNPGKMLSQPDSAFRPGRVAELYAFVQLWRWEHAVALSAVAVAASRGTFAGSTLSRGHVYCAACDQKKRTRLTACLCQRRRCHRHVPFRTRIITRRGRGLARGLRALEPGFITKPFSASQPT